MAEEEFEMARGQSEQQDQLQEQVEDFFAEGEQSAEAVESVAAAEDPVQEDSAPAEQQQQAGSNYLHQQEGFSSENGASNGNGGNMGSSEVRKMPI